MTNASYKYTNRYVISVKRIKSYNRVDLPEEGQFWEYAMNDSYAGAMSTGYPCWGSEKYANTFSSIEEAKEWFEGCKLYLVERYSGTINQYDYDWSTLGIRRVIYKTEEMLHI